MKVPYEKINACELKFSHGHASFSYDWDAIEYYDEYEWSSSDFVIFMDSELRTLPEYVMAGNEICNAYDIPDERRETAIRIGLSGFLRGLMNQVPSGRVDDSNIEEYIQTFIQDYEIYKGDNLFLWEIRIWLGNIDLEGDLVQLGNVILRKPVVQELSLVRQRSHYIDEFQKITGRSLFSTTILQFSMRAEKQVIGLYSDKIRNEIEVCLDVLRLFKMASIFTTHESVQPVSVLETGHSGSSESPFDKSWKNKIGQEHTSRYSCVLKKDEEINLIEFFQKIRPILSTLSPTNYLSGSYLDLAVHRYKDSLLRSEVNVNRLVSAVSCLEALLSNSSSEITYKISLHVAALLGYLDFNTIRVFEKMKTAYRIRSVILHGSKLDSKLLDFSKRHTHEIVNYARLCLVVCLQLRNKISKDDLIKKIDFALIDQQENLELNEMVKEEVTIPVVYPFRTIENGDEFQSKNIACIGWGSLIWQPRDLMVESQWNADGPALPVEFVRESQDKRITLVIDKESTPITTLWALMRVKNLKDAIKSLSEREKSPRIDWVKATDSSSEPIKRTIIEWLRSKQIDAAIWTALECKFHGVNNRRPSIEEVIIHLKGLDPTEKAAAEEYIRKAPEQVKTVYRKKIEEQLGWTSHHDKTPD